MEIAIVGAGKFGKQLTKMLSAENHNIVIIDKNSEEVNELVNQYDIRGYVGNGASYYTLKEAGVEDCDVLIATTSSDEVNFLIGLTARKLGVKTVIIRIRDREYYKQASLMQKELGYTFIINPDNDAARNILRSIRFPSAIKVDTFANNKVDLAEIKIEADSQIVNKSLSEINKEYQVTLLACAVIRDDKVIIPRGDFVLLENDIVYLTADTKTISKSFRKLGLIKNKLSSMMIIGGGRSALPLAKMVLDLGLDVKIVEKKIDLCHQLSEELPGAVIVNGDGTNQDLLQEEGISKIDCVVTMTDYDETNLVVSTYAKGIGVDKVITKIGSLNYEQIANSMGLDSVISPKEIFANVVIGSIRGLSNIKNKDSKLISLIKLANNKIEAGELVVEESAKYVNVALKDLHIKNNYIIAAILRNGKVIIPGGNDVIMPFDHVIVITTNNSIVDLDNIME